MVRLLAAGPGLLAVWETLDETGAVETILPEWEQVRLLPHASVVHRFTVDRHMVETCIEASALIRRVARPDVLMAAARLQGRAVVLRVEQREPLVVEPVAALDALAPPLAVMQPGAEHCDERRAPRFDPAGEAEVVGALAGTDPTMA